MRDAPEPTPRLRRRFRLLPEGHPLGWTPYAWLLYMATFFIEPVIRTQYGRAGVLYWSATLLGFAAFLALYFRAHWERGVRLVPYAAALTLLGVAFAPFNTGASVLFVYGAATAANVDRPRQAWSLVLAIAAVGTITAWLTSAPLYGYLVGSLVTVLVGGVNIFFASEARAQAKLRMAQEEIEHLAAVAERERIARDLHDILGHTLSMITLKAELARRLALRSPERAIAEMKDVEDAARRTLQEVREAIRGYRATLADERIRAEAMLTAADIRAELDLDEGPLPQAVEEALALALREAVTNVVRHSGASSCRAFLERRPGEVVLVVSDDGRGMGAREGAGLRGMRERVEAFGGTVHTDMHASPMSRGLRLRVSMPVARPQDEPQASVRETAG
jgi:two-component system, NarL family, sensor histidine kinase DesK